MAGDGRWTGWALTLVASLALASCAGDDRARGRYLLLIGHCNNCHTAGYSQKEGDVPEKDWLLGSGRLGWRGPWGTTYAPNLRVNVAAMDEDTWVRYMRTLRTRPPMPWWSVNATSEADLRAMYHAIQQLGPVGPPAQAFLPPDQEPKPPYVQYPANRSGD